MLPRNKLLTMFSHSLNSVNGESLVRSWLSEHMQQVSRMWVVAIGKAAESMFQGVRDSYPGRIESALVITKYQHLLQSGSTESINLKRLEAGHPYPDENSLRAGRRLLQFIEEVPESATVLFLISGGTSSLVEVLPEHVSVDELNRFNKWLLAQGWPINVMNHYRKSVSLIKAGRLANYLQGRHVIQLLISDVPDNDMSVIGSGLLVADKNQLEAEQSIPEWLVNMQTHVPEKPKEDDACFENIHSFLIGDNTMLRNTAADLAREMNLPVRCNQHIEGDVTLIAAQMVQQLSNGERGCYIWGGEGVIQLPESPGKGGRCQMLALLVAVKIQGRNDICFLAAGSDGTDGPGDVAGAIIDGQTVARGRDAGYNAEKSLAGADAGSFLAASGDLIDTGPTGTNVMDLIIAIKN